MRARGFAGPRWAALVAFVPCVLATVGATAAPGTRVHLLEVAHGELPLSVRRQVLAALATGLATRGAWQVGQEPLVDRAPVAPRLQALLAKAKAASAEFREAEALRLLQDADRLFREAYGPQTSVEPLVEVLLALAKLEAETGHPERGGWALTRVAVLDPARSLDPGRYAPVVVQMFDRLRARVAKETGTLVARSTPEGQPIWIDGRYRGQAPVTATVTAGEHFVAVGAFGGTAGRAVTVSAGGRADVLLSPPAPSGGGDATLKAIGRRLGASWVVAVALQSREEGWQITARPVAADGSAEAQVLRSRIVGEDRLSWAAGELSGALAFALHRSLASPGPPEGDRLRRRRPFWAAWWFWTGVAVAAGGAAAASAVVLTRPEPVVHLRLAR